MFGGDVQLEAPQIMYPEELACFSFPANNKWQFQVAAVGSTNPKSRQGHLLLFAPWADASGFIHTYCWASQALEIAMVSWKSELAYFQGKKKNNKNHKAWQMVCILWIVLFRPSDVMSENSVHTC